MKIYWAYHSVMCCRMGLGGRDYKFLGALTSGSELRPKFRDHVQDPLNQSSKYGVEWASILGIFSMNISLFNDPTRGDIKRGSDTMLER